MSSVIGSIDGDLQVKDCKNKNFKQNENQMQFTRILKRGEHLPGSGPHYNDFENNIPKRNFRGTEGLGREIRPEDSLSQIGQRLHSNRGRGKYRYVPPFRRSRSPEYVQELPINDFVCVQTQRHPETVKPKHYYM